MKLSNRVLLAASLSLSLLGCQTVAPTQLSAPGLAGQQAAHAMGTVSLTIRWPDVNQSGYSVAALPHSTKAFKMTLRQGDQVITEKTLKRSEANWQQDADGIATSTLKLDLRTGQDYILEAKAYSSETVFSDANQVAMGVSSPFEIRSGHRTPVRISLTVPNGPQVSAISHGAGAAGSRITLTGTNFGADPSKLKAFLLVNGYERRAATVEALNAQGTEVTIVIPSFDYAPQGLAKIRLYVDGISANEQDFRFVQELMVDPSDILNKTEHTQSGPVTTLYAIAGKPFSAPVMGRYWNPSTGQQEEASIPYTVKVRQNGNEVPGAVDPDGRITLANLGAYTLEFTSGSLKREFTCQAMTLNWQNYDPGTLKISKLFSVTGHQQMAEVNLPAYLTDGTSPAVWFRPSDFDWTFSNPGVILTPSLSNQWYDSQPKMQFEATSFTGETTVTATLKLDPSKSFSFKVANIGLKGFVFNVPKLTLRANETAEIHAQLRLTDDTIVNPKDKHDIRSKFLWSIDNATLGSIQAKTPQNQWENHLNGVGGFTSGSQLGQGTITLRWSDDTTVQGTIPVEVTDDGQLDLTIE
jgi:hypothetical protein